MRAFKDELCRVINLLCAYLTQEIPMSNWLRVFLVVPFFLFVTLAQAEDEQTSQKLQNAIAWLASQQQQGEMTSINDSALPWKTTSSAFFALKQTGSLELISAQELLVWLEGNKQYGSEFLASFILVKSSLGMNTDIELMQLIERQNVDGGFGDELGFDSTVYDTTFALMALSFDIDKYQAEIFSAIDYLNTRQQEDFSFQLENNNPSLVLTAQVLLALQPYLVNFDVSELISTSQRYLLQQIKTSIILKELQSWEIAFALLAIVPITIDDELYKLALEQISISQENDGSWSQDSFTTALAIRVLHQISTITSVNDPALSQFKGRIVRDDNSQPIKNANVVITDNATKIELISQSGSDGQFEINNISTGDFTLNYQADGYHAATYSNNFIAPSIFDLGTIKLVALPETGLVKGNILAADTLQPLANALITVKSSTTSTTTTTRSNSEGYYSVSMAPGDLTIIASQEGYQSLQGSAHLNAANSLTFSPSLTKEGQQTNPELVSIIGSLTDENTGQFLTGVSVQIKDQGVNTATGTNGQFVIDNIPLGVLNLEFSLAGYKSFQESMLLAKGGQLDLGNVQLQADSVQNLSSLTGQVVDETTGQPLINSKVILTEYSPPDKPNEPGVVFTQVTDSQGYYEFTSVDFFSFNVFVQATGYLSKLQSLQQDQPSINSLDFLLKPFSAGGINITKFILDNSSYDAYQNINIETEISNNSNSARNVELSLVIEDAQGNTVQRILIGNDKDPTGRKKPTSLMPMSNSNVNDLWFTSNYAPGNYRMLLTAYDAGDSRMLASSSQQFVITPTHRLEKMALQASPRISRVGAEEDLSVSAVFNYYGNIEYAYELNYQLINSDDEVVLASATDVSFQPSDTIKAIAINTSTITFNNSGRYLLQGSISNETEVNIVPDWVVVAPSTRIDINQTLTPNQVLPGSEHALKVEIQLKGVEAL